MAFTPVENLKLHKQVDRVLHVPGNYKGGILEMTIVIDCAYPKDAISALCNDIVVSCKFMSEIFRNVRLNVVKWSSSGIQNEVTAMAYLQMGSFFESYCQEENTGVKSSLELMQYLKKFHARSKLIILLIKDGSTLDLKKDEEKEEMLQALNPFLKQKLVVFYPEDIVSGGEFARKLIFEKPSNQ